NIFIKRFFQNQFKRSAMPDGPKITEISLSPRGDFKMSSDSSYNSFIN
ncbi:NH(3)-dependent NAD(+) synthetase, partial [Candidatus Arthromitus sp. SFB-co]